MELIQVVENEVLYQKVQEENILSKVFCPQCRLLNMIGECVPSVPFAALASHFLVHTCSPACLHAPRSPPILGTQEEHLETQTDGAGLRMKTLEYCLRRDFPPQTKILILTFH